MYFTDIVGGMGRDGIVRRRLFGGSHAPYERLNERFNRFNAGHPLIARDESFILFDVAAGWIHVVGRSSELERRLVSEGEGRAVHVFADEGLWYDALTSLGDRMEQSPGDPELAEMRSSLLRQVGLQDVASGVL